MGANDSLISAPVGTRRSWAAAGPAKPRTTAATVSRRRCIWIPREVQRARYRPPAESIEGCHGADCPHASPKLDSAGVETGTLDVDFCTGRTSGPGQPGTDR